MCAETMTPTMTETTDTGDDDPKWTRPAILRREGREYNLTEAQRDALVATVRNPDASPNEIADHADVDAMSINNLLKSMRRGIVGNSGKSHDTDYDSRLNEGTADFTDETVKRRAVIDYVARHRGVFDLDEWSHGDVADVIQDELGVAMHETYAYNVYDEYKHLVHKRRDWYERHGRDDEIVPADELSHPGNDGHMTTREKLEAAGVTDLPDGNLDGLLPAAEAKERGRQRGVERSAEVLSSAGDSGDASGACADASDDATRASDDAVASTQPASGSGNDAGMVDEPKTTERESGNARYEGPATGIDLTGGRPSSVLVGPEDDGSGDVSDELARVREECGPFGQTAADRDLDISDREALEHEIKVLRILVAQQGEYIDQLRRALDNMFVNVEAGFTIPTDDDGE